METKTVYECDYCGNSSEDPIHIEYCERWHRDEQEWLSKQPKWGQDFVKEVGISVYKEALRLLEASNNQVEIFRTDELAYVCWAIVPIADTEFWLHNFDTKKEAEDFCEEMGWKYD